MKYALRRSHNSPATGMPYLKIGRLDRKEKRVKKYEYPVRVGASAAEDVVIGVVVLLRSVCEFSGSGCQITLLGHSTPRVSDRSLVSYQ